MRRRVYMSGCALVALLAADVSPARAELPVRRISLFGGLRVNHGGLGADFPWTVQIIGAEAAWLVGKLGDNFRWGPVWWAQVSRFVYPGQGSVNPELGLAEMGLGARLDWRMPFEVPFMAHVQLAGEWYRASNPIPPDDDDTYFGGQLKFGVEYGSENFFTGLWVSNALLPWMPSSTTIMGCVGVGGR